MEQLLDIDIYGFKKYIRKIGFADLKSTSALRFADLKNISAWMYSIHLQKPIMTPAFEHFNGLGILRKIGKLVISHFSIFRCDRRGDKTKGRMKNEVYGQDAFAAFRKTLDKVFSQSALGGENGEF
jgi:hypothetical protein